MNSQKDSRTLFKPNPSVILVVGDHLPDERVLANISCHYRCGRENAPVVVGADPLTGFIYFFGLCWFCALAMRVPPCAFDYGARPGEIAGEIVAHEAGDQAWPADPDVEADSDLGDYHTFY